MESEIMVFVYGTLKRGQPQNHKMMDTNTGKAELITHATTCRSFPLVIASSYNIPFLLNRPGTGYQIEGEVYRVDQRKFDFLDEFEEYPQFYTRQKIEVTSTCDQKDQKDINHTSDSCNVQPARGPIKKWTAWVYLLSNFKPYLLTLPFYSNYDSFGPHNLPFVVRSKRPPNDPHGLAKSEVGQE